VQQPNVLQVRAEEVHSPGPDDDMEMTNPPFMPEKGQPPYHLRPSTPEELATHRRLVEKQEALRREPRLLQRN
jgi:hypothetical protein